MKNALADVPASTRASETRTRKKSVSTSIIPEGGAEIKEKNEMCENLRRARLDKKMTQKQVAEYLGIGLRAYQHIEKGVYIGRIEHWDKLEDLFGIHQRILREFMPD